MYKFNFFNLFFIKKNNIYFLRELDKNLSFKLSIVVNSTASEKAKDKLQKVKLHLISCHSKMTISNNELNKYKEILEGLNSNLDIKSSTQFFDFINSLNKLLLLNSQDEDDISMMASNDNSVKKFKYFFY